MWLALMELALVEPLRVSLELLLLLQNVLVLQATYSLGTMLRLSATHHLQMTIRWLVLVIGNVEIQTKSLTISTSLLVSTAFVTVD